MDQEVRKCSCGRSITGDCMNCHNLSNEEYERVRMEAEQKLMEERIQPQLLNE